MTENGRIQVDPSDLTLAEYAEIEGELGEGLDVLLNGTGKWRAIAAMAWIVQRRDDPAYTLADALQLRMRDIEMVNPEQADAPFGPAANSGVPPPASLGSRRLDPVAVMGYPVGLLEEMRLVLRDEARERQRAERRRRR